MPADEIRRLMRDAGLKEVSAEIEKNSYKGVFEK
jgi:hypothetical protein